VHNIARYIKEQRNNEPKQHIATYNHAPPRLCVWPWDSLLRIRPVSAARHGEYAVIVDVVVVVVVPGDPPAILWCRTLAKVGTQDGLFVVYMLRMAHT
jgi:hypothetical protein